MKIKVLSKANSAWLLLAGAIVLAALMSFAVLRYLEERERALQDAVVEKARGGPKVMVAVPIRDVPAGTFINRDVFVSRPIDADLVYPDMVKVDDFDHYENRKTLYPVLHGRPLRVGDVDSTDRPLAASVPRGLRAITINTDVTNSIANMIRPGDLVDLYLLATPSAAGGSNGARADSTGDVSSLLLQKMMVLATGKQVLDKTAREQPRIVAEDGAPVQTVEYDTLTLQATPEQASRLALAQKVGAIRAVLRGINDSDSITPSTIASGTLFPSSDPEAVNLRSVQYIVGGQGEAAISNRSVPALAGALAAAAGARGVAVPPPAAARAPAPAADNRTLVLVPNKPASSNGNEPSVFFPSSPARR